MTAPRPLSDRQLAANRANAQRSTGPRTPAGKARSRWNTLTHGALAQALIPPALEGLESRAAFDELLASLRVSLAPASPLEEMLVERIAVSYWRLARLLRAESSAIAFNQESLRYQQSFADAPVSDLSEPIDPYGSQKALASRLRAVLSDQDSLRDLMSSINSAYQSATIEQLQQAACLLIEQITDALPALRARLDAIQRDVLRVPALEQALPYSRYEASLERQFYRALNALERQQRLRQGEPVPPPLELRVDAEAAGLDIREQ